MKMIWTDRCDGIQSNQINGTYYVRWDIEPDEWFAEWCGPHDADIMISKATKEDCMNACFKHYSTAIEEAFNELTDDGEPPLTIYNMDDFR